jgi:uncharacterized iron-regulated membrane protein
MGYLDKPQRVWWRKVLFQVHLWVGIILGLYMIVIGLTGSLLVFKDELATMSYPRFMTAPHHGPPGASLPAMMDNAGKAYPKHKMIAAYLPGVFGDTFFAYMEEGESFLYVFADPADGHIFGAVDLQTSWLFWVSELHVRLLAGQTGFILNGIGGLFLVLLCITGLVLWWPGISAWTRGLKVSFRRNWKRINFDLHSAVGFWLLALVFIWALSGAYFVWPKQFEQFVGQFSSVKFAQEPEFQITPVSGQAADVSRMLTQAAKVSTGSLAGIYLPEDPKVPVTVFLGREGVSNFSLADRVYFHPSTGELLGIWHSGVNPTFGSKVIYWLGPLHFGVYWGLGIKILWAVFGLSLPLLTVTGALMYWNRSLSNYWRRLKASRKQRSLAIAPHIGTEA